MQEHIARPPSKKVPPGLRLAIDFGPLLIFFVADAFKGIYFATEVLLLTTLLSFLISWLTSHKLPLLPAVGLCFVLILGGATIVLGDEEYIKLEVTLSNAICGIFLLANLYVGQSLLKIACGDFTEIDDAEWRRLTLHMGIFLLSIAAANEAVRRFAATETWVAFRVYGLFLLNFIFVLCQAALVKRIQPSSEGKSHQ
jgi:intracellular septation protein